MFKLKKILFTSIFLAFAEIICPAQSNSIKSDTTRVIQKDNSSSVASKNQNQKSNQSSLQNSNAKSNGNTTVKMVKGARPDMSKAHGARPNIVRPAGSGIPRGIGKPSGFGKPGGK